MILSQQTPNSSDFDVILSGDSNPSFRMLLPERVLAEGLDHGGLHTIPGIWNGEANWLEGRFSDENTLEFSVRIDTYRYDTRVELTLKNIGNHEITDLWAEVCTSLNHLPGNPNFPGDSFPGISLVIFM